MATQCNRNIYEVYNVCNVINSHIFICTWFYSPLKYQCVGMKLLKYGRLFVSVVLKKFIAAVV